MKIDKDLVAVISRYTSWDGLPIKTLREFSQACGMDFTNSAQMRRADQYVIERGLLAKATFLRRSPHWKTHLEPLLELWLKSLQT
jgi:hypothetical protein